MMQRVSWIWTWCLFSQSVGSKGGKTTEKVSIVDCGEYVWLTWRSGICWNEHCQQSFDFGLLQELEEGTGRADLLLLEQKPGTKKWETKAVSGMDFAHTGAQTTPVSSVLGDATGPCAPPEQGTNEHVRLTFADTIFCDLLQPLLFANGFWAAYSVLLTICFRAVFFGNNLFARRNKVEIIFKDSDLIRLFWRGGQFYFF